MIANKRKKGTVKKFIIRTFRLKKIAHTHPPFYTDVSRKFNANECVKKETR